MGSFSKKSLWVVIAFLLIANLALVGFVFFGRGGPFKGGGPKLGDYLRTELKMTPEQESYFQESLSKLREKKQAINQEKRSLKKEVLTNLNTESVSDSIMRNLSDLEYRSERAVFEHFQEIRSSLSEQQALKFDEIIVDAHEKFGPKRGPDGGPGPGGGRHGKGPKGGHK